MTVVYRAARLFDGMDAMEPANGVAVAVDEGRITAVGPAGAEFDGTDGVDLGDATLLPGLIDAHVHLVWDGGDAPDQRVHRESRAMTVLRAANHARAHLASGVTTVRDLGSTDGLALDIAAAVAADIVPGPRIVAAGRAITITGGHVHCIGREADGSAAVRRAVRQEIKAGARCVKVMASGGVLGGPHEQPGAPQFTRQELLAVVEEAHAADRHVAAHAHSLVAINNAISAGVDSVEHGSHLDPPTARRMREERIVLVPTLSAVDAVRRQATTGGAVDVAARAADIAKHSRAAFHCALRQDVPMAAGSDAGVPGQPHGCLAAELAAMVRAGASPSTALRSATANAARLLRVDQEVGTLTAGKRADLIAVRGNPTTDITALDDLALVIVGGVRAERVR